MSTYNDEILSQIALIDAQLKAQGTGPQACAGLAVERMRLEARFSVSDQIREDADRIAASSAAS